MKAKQSSIPIAVQTFPTSDDFTYEKEKLAVASLSDFYFEEYEKAFLLRLSTAHKEVECHMIDFFDAVRRACSSAGEKRASYVADSLREITACSPKRILAEFQRQSLVAGWAYVSVFNTAIDKLSELFPRCRAGIYASRLKYSDVLQISSEITETLRSCSILIDDLQRRYEMLEALQNDIQTDIETPEAEVIISAMKETFADNERYGRNVDCGIDEVIKKTTSVLLQPLTAVGDLMALPSLQIQGQMQRTRRMVLFLETAKMLAEGWKEWKAASQEIITPNLNVMFSLKRDFFRNQMVCLCDIITCNGYELKSVAGQLYDAAKCQRIVSVKGKSAVASMCEFVKCAR